MNTGFLNRCRVLINTRRRALVIGQTLCLIVVAAIFFVAPFVAFAGCGNNNNNIKVDKSIKAIAATTQINPVPAANALNLSFIPKGVTALDSMTLHPVTAADIVTGHWITLAKQDNNGKTEVFQGSIFKVSDVNNGQKVVELWVAELPGGGTTANTLGLKIGQKFINVSESTLLGQNNNNNNNNNN
ncbi:MAG TPA: hypothetical protein VGL94_12780 [Ktedonobacteraceae bacterium]